MLLAIMGNSLKYFRKKISTQESESITAENRFNDYQHLNFVRDELFRPELQGLFSRALKVPVPTSFYHLGWNSRLHQKRKVREAF